MFEFATPWAFLALPLPLLVYLYWSRQQADEAAALYVPFFNKLSAHLPPLSSTQNSSLIAQVLIWVLLIIAASGPRYIGPPHALDRQGHSILLVLDVSGSMAIDDFIVNGRRSTRMHVVKQTANEFVQARKEDQIGLILFGSQAYLQTPLTFDKQTIHERINDATVGLAGNSTSMGDALGLAIKHLKNTHQKGRIVILLTDGANNSGVLPPLKAADIAHDNLVKVYTIGLGSDYQFDEKTLKTIAEKTDGLYFNANDLASLETTYQRINAMETITQDAALVQPKREYYPWPLALALLIFVLNQLNIKNNFFYKKMRKPS